MKVLCFVLLELRYMDQQRMIVLDFHPTDSYLCSVIPISFR